MLRVNTDALQAINLALGITGRGAQLTEFMDGQLDQTIDVTRLIRRGRTLINSTGLFVGVLHNVHPAADNLVTSVDLYSIGATAAIEPFPAAIPAHFDLWLLTASLYRAAGAGGLTNATMILDYAGPAQGFGIDDSGTAIVAVNNQSIAYWDSIVTQGVTSTFGLRGTNGPQWRGPLRIARGTTLRFASTSAAAATFELQLLVGLFPIGMGQDGCA